MKLKKIPQLPVNPSANHEHIQVLRKKINEVISFLNQDSEITSKTVQEQISEKESELQNAIKAGDYIKVSALANDIKNLKESK